MDLQQQLSESFSDVIKTIFLPDITIEELPIARSKHRPDMLHAAVHGSRAGLWFAKQAFDDSERQLVNLSGQALADFLEPDDPPRLIFLNACESSQVAKSLADRGFLAIGTTAPITNQAAIAATRLLYHRINGRHISESFRAMDSLVAFRPSGSNSNRRAQAGYSRQAATSQADAGCQAGLSAFPDSVGLSPLPGVDKEVERVRDRLEAGSVCLFRNADATRDRIMRGLRARPTWCM
ncbi:CHAT domain-containing protein [Rhizobium leguminosarum]|uniref:CHAT domain-containing protein n=1 Tax=Rhizobium leguminosarum TaxID=384 RepID=UPI001C91B6B4|nr:CHAT domain-containing protein [Rhizobium leguminosarum]MBY2937197.1 hypothetical protein [Rhizobium leguminosarum]